MKRSALLAMGLGRMCHQGSRPIGVGGLEGGAFWEERGRCGVLDGSGGGVLEGLIWQIKEFDGDCSRVSCMSDLAAHSASSCICAQTKGSSPIEVTPKVSSATTFQ